MDTTYFFLRFYEKDGLLGVSLSPCGGFSKLCKGDPLYRNLDYDPYLRLLLDAGRHMPIEKIATFDDEFNDGRIKKYHFEKLQLWYRQHFKNREYTLSVTLDTQPNYHDLKRIFDRCAMAGVIFLDEKVSSPAKEIAVPASSDDIVNQLSAILPYIQANNPRQIPGFMVKIHDSYCYLLFSLECNLLHVTLMPFASLWMKQAYGIQSLDYDRYLRILLDICADFPLLEIRTYDSYSDLKDE